MNITSDDIKDMLLTSVELGLTFGGDLFIGKMPTSPDNCVVIFDAGGEPTEQSLDRSRYHRDSVSIHVRHNSYVTGYALAEQIEAFLISKSQTIINNVLYTSILSESGVVANSWDENSNHAFLININVQRR